MKTKTKNGLTWVLAGLLAFAFIGAGLTKILGVEAQIKNLESWGFPLWLRFPIGLGEIALAVGLLIPAFRKLAIYATFAWTVVAVLTHVQAGQASMIGAAILFSVLAGIILLLQNGQAATTQRVKS